ncbi:MAG: acyl-CoA thioesterase [Anaerolineaceae bacterium]|nr:PaaI family thioesterase [Chloroflexota bacterium]MCL4823232.1 PaaI family thioesterase [Anaerolineales bacterium]GJQ39538.1 MAG: acyl-CoA thioesterase [Anaerolineaceae bacterium]NOG74436.1 PaaI family thioesterase [Chloroflexota bacterium]WKZ50047.1 MAG: PaaI family thioesterase [Anaerolineales bacterium]
MRTKQPNSLQCFVCGLENPIGLHIHFYETAPGEVTAEYTAPENYQGYPGILHGGITAAILDEATGRSFMGTDAAASQFMYTAELKVKYKKKVPVGQPLKIVGRRVKRMRWTAEATAAIYDADGELLAEAAAILVNLPEQPPAEDLERLGWKVYPD